MIDRKDLHVLAAGVEGKSEFLLTLDRKHVLAAAGAAEKADLPIRVLTPGDFIRQVYPQYEAFPALPPWRSKMSIFQRSMQLNVVRVAELTQNKRATPSDLPVAWDGS